MTNKEELKINYEMNKQTIIIIILSILLAGVLLFYFYGHTLNKGIEIGKKEMVIDMNINAYFPLIIQQGNQTIVKKTAIENLCKRIT